MLAVLRVRAWAQCVTCHWPDQPVSLCETTVVPRLERGGRRVRDAARRCRRRPRREGLGGVP